MGLSLTKGQKISLTKEAGGKTLTRVIMGLGWDVKKIKGWFGDKPGNPVDLDASCLMFDEKKQLVDAVWFRQLASKDGSIRHTGDNRTGEGEGDDEQIIVELARVPSTVKTLMFVVCNFTGQGFDTIDNAFCRLVDGTNNVEIAKFNLSSGGKHTAQVMAKVYLHNNEWKMHAIGENATGRVFNDMLPAILPHV